MKTGAEWKALEDVLVVALVLSVSILSGVLFFFKFNKWRRQRREQHFKISADAVLDEDEPILGTHSQRQISETELQGDRTKMVTVLILEDSGIHDAYGEMDWIQYLNHEGVSASSQHFQTGGALGSISTRIHIRVPLDQFENAHALVKDRKLSKS